jgi:hypothetical protein
MRTILAILLMPAAVAMILFAFILAIPVAIILRAARPRPRPRQLTTHNSQLATSPPNDLSLHAIGSGSPPTRAAFRYIVEVARQDRELAALVIGLHRLYWLGRPITLPSIRQAMVFQCGRTTVNAIEHKMLGFPLTATE